ncbi:hypothetical protein SDC9_92752 [bioreactor metagenome]|uniref:Inner membrane protein n=1 Tax=bioreactor metagenome TaxID=1076179 RepID=A0A645A020_9ZZZZ|nr:YgjV family protein [Candidatus Metalachnospira sp.]
MRNLIIGNILSFIAAVFLGISCYAKDRKKIFTYQLVNCATYTVASYFFGTYAAITTLIFCCIRSILIMKDRYTSTAAYILVIAVIAFGIMANNRGIVGLLPVIASVVYNLCCYYITDPHLTRYSILINELIWVTYAFIIKDFSTGISDTIIIIVDITAIIHYHNKLSTENIL